MSASVERTVIIQARPELVLAVISDFDSYPAWQQQVENCKVHERDSEGRPVLVTITTAAMGMSIPARVRVSYGDGEMEYHLVEPAGVAVQQDAHYVLRPVDEEATELHLTMEVDLKWSLPAIMLTQMVTKGVNDNLKAVKHGAERQAAAGTGGLP